MAACTRKPWAAAARRGELQAGRTWARGRPRKPNARLPRVSGARPTRVDCAALSEPSTASSSEPQGGSSPQRGASPPRGSNSPRDRGGAVSRAERHALGRRLLADGGVLWSALPVEWPTEGARGSVADPPELPGLWWRVWASLVALLRRPGRSFAYVQEPVAHGAVLRLLLAVRLPLWGALLAALAVRAWLLPAGATKLKPIHDTLDPRLCEVLSLWLLLMVPIGVPLLYFGLGMATHVALALTGGAPRSIAASMRASGYALAPALVGIAAIDVPLQLGLLPGVPYLALLGVVGLSFFHQLGQALTGTHVISPVRGYLVAVVPLVMVLAAQLGRALLVLPDFPGWSVSASHPYFIP